MSSWADSMASKMANHLVQPKATLMVYPREKHSA